jgi:hypothetical protein
MSNATGRGTNNGSRQNTWFRIGTLAVVLVALTIIMLLFVKPHFYILQEVGPDQVGVRIRGGQIMEIVPAGVYSDLGWYVKLETYSIASYQFTVVDPEVLTRDQQRLAVTVSGSVFRPFATDQTAVKALWAQYRPVFLSDDALQKVMNDLSMQTMKVCVGDRPFSESVVGSSRDSLRGCINDELAKLVQPYGLRIANVTVPNVGLSPEVQAKLDAITQSRLDTEKALQDEQKAVAQGKASQAEQEAAIRVEQSKRQEETRQETTLAQLEQEQLKAQQAVITQQKANDLLAAQKELEIAKAKAVAAEEQAKADLAQQTALAKLYAEDPGYLQLMLAQANASAIKSTDKVIFAPNGQFPYLVLGGNVVPTLSLPQNTGPQAPASQP